MGKPHHSSLGRAAPLLFALLALPLAYLLLKPADRRARRRNSAIIRNAGEAIITTDAGQRILHANPAAVAMFGTTAAAMRGAALETFIPRDLRTLGEQAGEEHAGDTDIQLRMMGRRAIDHTITGLRAGGERFPLEGSIASQGENGATIYTLILRDITERKHMHAQLEHSYTQLRLLSATLQTIREEERKHIARELHDDLGQLLATLRLDLTLLQQHADAYQPSAAILRNMDQLIVTAIASLRRIAGNLRPRALDEGGLYFALHSLRNDFIQRHPVAFELLADENELILDDAYSTAIYRIVQESLTNIARHAQARKVTVALQRIGAQLTICIQDDGRGIVDSDMAKAASFGLLGMRERVWGLHGDISIRGNDGGGTRIDIVLPLPPAPAPA